MSFDSQTSDLLPRIARGDQTAVAGCLDRYGGLVWSLTSRALGAGPEAEDVAQDIFVELWRKSVQFDPGKGKEATFVAMIARRRIIDRLRQRTAQPAPDPIETAAMPAAVSGDRLEQDEEMKRIEDAMTQLNPEQAQAIRLSVCEGLTQRQVAERLDVPLGTVKTNVRRGLLRLREMLGVRQPAPTGEVAR